jgi:hypothetical protein
LHKISKNLTILMIATENMWKVLYTRTK